MTFFTASVPSNLSASLQGITYTYSYVSSSITQFARYGFYLGANAITPTPHISFQPYRPGVFTTNNVAEGDFWYESGSLRFFDGTHIVTVVSSGSTTALTNAQISTGLKIVGGGIYGDSSAILSIDPTYTFPAANVTSGTFAGGDYTFPSNLFIQASASFGGGDVIIASASQAVILIDGTDAVITAGHNGIAENGGNLNLSTRGGLQIFLDNDSNQTNAIFGIGSQGNVSNLLQLDELGDFSLSGSMAIGVLGATAATGVLDVRAGSQTTFGDYRDYIVIRTSPSVADDGGILLTNSVLTSASVASFKITSTFSSPGNSARMRMGFVKNNNTELFTSGAALEIRASGDIALAQTTGLVGIGKVSPTADLDVVGNTFLSGTTTTTGDVIIGSLGDFDSTKAPQFEQFLSFNGTKWIPRTLQNGFVQGVVGAGSLADGTTAVFANASGSGVGGHGGNPPLSASYDYMAPSASALYGGILITIPTGSIGVTGTGHAPFLPQNCVYVIDYSSSLVNGWITNAIFSTAPEVIHSNLNFSAQYQYRYSISGSTGSQGPSTGSNFVVPSAKTEVNAFGLVLAEQIATVNLAAINADIGVITAGRIQSNDTSSGILISKNYLLPPSFQKFIDFTSTGSQPFIYVSGTDFPSINVSANGDTASFHGTIFALGELVSGSSTFLGPITAVSESLTIKNILNSKFSNTLFVSQSNPVGANNITIADGTETLFGWSEDFTGSTVLSSSLIIGDYQVVSGALTATQSANWIHTNHELQLAFVHPWTSGSGQFPQMTFTPANNQQAYNKTYYVAGGLRASTLNLSCSNFISADSKVNLEVSYDNGTTWTLVDTLLTDSITTLGSNITHDKQFSYPFIPTSSLNNGDSLNIRLVYYAQLQATSVNNGIFSVSDNTGSEEIPTRWSYSVGTTMHRRGLQILNQSSGSFGSIPHVNLMPLSITPSSSNIVAGDLWSEQPLATGPARLMFDDGINVRQLAPSATFITASAISFAATSSAYTPFDNSTVSSNFNIDWTKGMIQKVTLGATGLTVTFTNPPLPGTILTLLVYQDAGGSRTITTWPGTVKWSNGGTAPTLTTTGQRADILTFLYNGTNYAGLVSGFNFVSL